MYPVDDVAQAHRISLRSTAVATEHEPYQVFVACAGATFDFGAGLPLTRRHVLTAAALVRGYSSWNVGFGSATFQRLQYIESSVAYMHPGYNGNTNNNNLAIIVLPTALPRGALVRPIRLPNDSDGVVPRVNQEGRLVGFGVVRETNATIAARAAPNGALKTVYLTVGSQNCSRAFASSDAARNFCASDDNADGMQLCRGDVGNAFVVQRRGEPVLAGFTSIVSRACRPTEPTAFVRVQAYAAWIAGVIANGEAF